MNQQEFLRDAMNKLGMTRDQLSKRISVPRKTPDKWLALEGANEHRAMPEIAWAYLREILNIDEKETCSTHNGGI